VSADLVMEKVVVTFDPAVTGARDLIEALTELGYTPQLWNETDKSQHTARLSKQREIRTVFGLFVAAFALTLPIFLIMMVFMHIERERPTTRIVHSECARAVQFALLAPMYHDRQGEDGIASIWRRTARTAKVARPVYDCTCTT
jgi:cation transport ATPase